MIPHNLRCDFSISLMNLLMLYPMSSVIKQVFTYLCASMCAWACAHECRCPQSSEECVRVPRVGVMSSCEPLDMGSGAHLMTSRRAISFFNPEPSLQSCVCYPMTSFFSPNIFSRIQCYVIPRYIFIHLFCLALFS